MGIKPSKFESLIPFGGFRHEIDYDRTYDGILQGSLSRFEHGT